MVAINAIVSFDLIECMITNASDVLWWRLERENFQTATKTTTTTTTTTTKKFI